MRRVGLGGVVPVASSLFKCRPRACSQMEEWFRHLSSLQGAAEQRDSVAGPVVPYRPVALCDVFLDNCWDRSWNKVMCVPDDGTSEFGSWSKVCREGQTTEAVEALDLMVQQESYVPDFLLYSVLKACSTKNGLVVGRRVHALSKKSGHLSNTFLANHIIRMYAAHGKVQEAVQVFSSLTAPDSFSWAFMILAHAEHGQPAQAVQLYQQMRQSDVKPNNHIFVAVLKACSSAVDLTSGKQVHADVLRSVLEPNVFVGNSLVDMYAKCGSLEDARRVFDSLGTKDVVTWNSMITGYAQHGLFKEALGLYRNMQQESKTPANYVTFVCLLKACANAGALCDGRELHLEIQERGFEADVTVGNSVVAMYAKCSSLEEARRVFDKMPTRDVVTWNVMIAGYVQHGLGQEALMLYEHLQEKGVVAADPATLVSLLKACASIGAVHQGKQLHLHIVERGLQADIALGSSLVAMYAKCGSLEAARKVFDRLSTKNVVTWNAMLTAYAQWGFCQEAFDLYADMQREGMILADPVTFVCLLNACSCGEALSKGKELHCEVQARGLEADAGVGSSLVDMYARCGSLEDARAVFDRLPTKDVVTWNVLIAGYAQHGLGQEALTLFAQMQQEAIKPPNTVTFICLLKACASVGALNQGRHLHLQIQERGLEADVAVGSSIVDMFAKCGSLDGARKVFDRLPSKNVVTWNALLNGYSQHSNSAMAIRCFQEMQQQGVEPNDATFLCLLVACSHNGHVHEARQYFRAMVQDFGIPASVHHCNIMVDVLGRAGHLDEAESMLETLPFESNVVGWTSLLSACRAHSDIQRATRCFDCLIKLEPQNAGAYVLLASMYATSHMWRDVERIESLRRSAGAYKKPARAWIEVNNRTHSFIVGDERDDIHSKLSSVNLQLKQQGGHVPHTELVMKPTSEKEKEDSLCGHAEKLALAYGLLNTPDGAVLLVTKNLRMCNDCHSGTKIMSRIEQREIIVRDEHRVHHFVNGFCSCGDRN